MKRMRLAEEDHPPYFDRTEALEAMWWLRQHGYENIELRLDNIGLTLLFCHGDSPPEDKGFDGDFIESWSTNPVDNSILPEWECRIGKKKELWWYWWIFD